MSADDNLHFTFFLFFSSLKYICIREFWGKYAKLSSHKELCARKVIRAWFPKYMVSGEGPCPFSLGQKERHMAIIYHEKTKTITLHTKNTSYQMKIGNLDYLLHLYYGPTIPDEDMNYQVMQYDRGFSGNPYESRNARTCRSCPYRPGKLTRSRSAPFRKSRHTDMIFRR